MNELENLRNSQTMMEHRRGSIGSPSPLDAPVSPSFIDPSAMDARQRDIEERERRVRDLETNRWTPSSPRADVSRQPQFFGCCAEAPSPSDAHVRQLRPVNEVRLLRPADDHYGV